jgi:hypothetical protein
MAQYGMIDGYLDTMRTEIRWLRDLDDVVSEMEDHLYSTVEGMLAIGLEPDVAQRETLERFGEPKLLAGLYASSNSGGIAVPTTTTIRAGTVALVAAAFWLIGAAIVWISNGSWISSAVDNGRSDDWVIGYLGWAIAVAIAGVLGLFVMVALGKRHGGFGAVGLIALVITSLGVALSVIGTWTGPVWMGLMGIGYLITGMKMWGPSLAPRAATALFTFGMLAGVAAFVIANALEVGSVNSDGDRVASFIIGQVTGQALTALGLIGLGLWLKSEVPVDTSMDAPLAA